jgi:DNA-3-methyladenine glycosylase
VGIVKSAPFLFMAILKRNFYNRDTLVVAKDLLGKFIIRQIGKKKLAGKIVEVEAYNGPNDRASHANRGKTERNKIMFGHPGFSYVYMIYGMYYCFNIVTESHGYPAAVLIRAVEPVNAPLIRGARGVNKTNGPGKFCKTFEINKKINGLDLCKKEKIWLEDRGIKIKKVEIARAKRIGVDYAGEYKNKLWRFYLTGNKFASN